jgi:aminoglycoside 2'-N-acetyltransferase I
VSGAAEGFDLQISHTADVDPAVLATAHGLLDVVFEGEMTDADWEHAIGGMHAMAWHGDQLIGHASVVQRRLVHRGRALRTGYVEGVGVHPTWKRRGVGGRMMAALERIIDSAYDIGALGATDEAVTMYTRRGWLKWLGRASAITPAGVIHTPDEEGFIYVLPGRTTLDLHGELTCDWRDGDVW